MSYQIVHPERNLPCWYCSRLLTRATTGEHKGKLVVARGIVDGHERTGHVECFKQDIGNCADFNSRPPRE